MRPAAAAPAGRRGTAAAVVSTGNIFTRELAGAAQQGQGSAGPARQRDKQTDRQTERQTDLQTDRQTDRLADRQILC